MHKPTDSYTNFYTVPTAGRMYVRSFVHPSVPKCTTMHREQTAGPRSANICTHMHVDKVHSPAISIKIVNVRYLHFKGKRFGSSTLVSSYVKFARVFVGMEDYTNRHHVKGCQEAQRTIPITKICQGVLA